MNSKKGKFIFSKVISCAAELSPCPYLRQKLEFAYCFALQISYVQHHYEYFLRYMLLHNSVQLHSEVASETFAQ